MEPTPAPTERYVAFLSYRHVDPDRRWAAWLLRKIETYRIPRRLARDLDVPRRLGKVFRDEEELAATSDLSGTIREALEGSRYLIVVCSPRTPASKWVDREIQAFRDLGRSGRILAWLGEGASDQSFPPSLHAMGPRLSDEPAAGEVAPRGFEPLAADARPVAGRAHARVLRTALLRVLARLIGCSYDDLRQRDQARRQRFWMAATAAASVLVLAFAVLAAYALHSRNLARVERDHARASGLLEASQLALASDPQRGLILARHAADLEVTKEVRSQLHAALEAPDKRWARPNPEGDYVGVAISPLGDRVLVESRGRRIRVFDADGEVRATLEGGTEWTVGPVYAPDGAFALVDGPRGSLLMLGRDGAVLHRAEAPEGERYDDWRILPGTNAVWACHGRTLVRFAADLTVAEELRASGTVRDYLVLPDGSGVCAAVDEVGLVRLDGSGSKVIHTGEVGVGTQLLWEQPGRVLLWLSSFDATKRLDLENPDASEDLPATHVATDPRLGLLATVSAGGLRIRDRDGRVVGEARGRRIGKLLPDVTGGAFVYLLSDGTISVLDATGHGVTYTGAAGADPVVVASALAGTRLVVGTRRDGVWLVDLSHADLGSFGLPGAGGGPSPWSGDGRTFVAAEGSFVLLCDRDGTLQQSFSTASVRVRSVALAPHGDTVAAGLEDGTARVWKTDGSPAAELRGHEGPVTKIAFSPDGRRVLTGGVDGTARLYDLDGRVLAALRGFTSPLRYARFSDDGSEVLTWDGGAGVRLWDADGKPKRLLDLGGEPVLAAGFLHGTDRIGLAGQRRVRVFEPDGHLAGTIEDPYQRIRGAVFASDGRMLVVGSPLRVLASDSHELSSLEKHVEGARIEPNGDRILTWSGGKIADLEAPSGTVPLGDHLASITAGCFGLLDGAFATATEDGSVHVWRRDGANLAVLPPSGAAVRALWPSRDGTRLLVLDDTGRMRLTVIDTPGLEALAARRVYRELTWRERVAYKDLLGDPGPEPDPGLAKLDELVATLERSGGAETPESLRLEGELDDRMHELVPGAREGEQLPELLALVARTHPDDAKRIENAIQHQVLAEETKRKLEALRSKLEDFHREKGRYPTKDEDVLVLDPGGTTPTDPTSSPIVDAWGSVFLYVPTKDGYALTSAGPDGVHGTPDDLH